MASSSSLVASIHPLLLVVVGRVLETASPSSARGLKMMIPSTSIGMFAPEEES